MSRIYVLDDSPVVLAMTVEGLRNAGYEARGAPDLAALDALLREAEPECILLDVRMPEMFGDDVLEFLRTEKRVSSRLLLFSDLPDEELEARAKKAGADGTVPKSRGMEAIVEAVAQQVKQPPVVRQARPKSEPRAPSPVAAKLIGRRILVVDDSEMTAKLIEGELQQKGYEVSVAENVDKATRIILRRQTRPDLILLDVNMPGVNGEQFCRFLKGNSLFAGIKVVLCSAANVEELKRICKEAGADGFVPKDAFMSTWVLKQIEPKHP
ncbi:MAG: response regulator [Deltaproteobacteria bacterium]|nr:response regulator [Deltaproteobacteria bacterium]